MTQQDLLLVYIILTLCYADDTVLKIKTKKLLDKIVEKNRKKKVTIICKEIECLQVKKNDSPTCKLHMKNVKKYKQVHEFNNLGNVICDTEM